MAGFVVVCIAVPVLLASLTQAATNPVEDAAREKMLRQRGGLDGQMLARVRWRRGGLRSYPQLRSLCPQANRERLAVLLSEVERKESGEERWRQALDGKTLGTSSGSSRGRHSGIEGAATSSAPPARPR